MFENLCSKFQYEFTDKSSIEIAFNLPEGYLDDVHIIFAHYEYEQYEGYAYVLFAKDNELFEVHGSHCSCYGLEEQWYPEHVTLEFLHKRITDKNVNIYGITLEEYTEMYNRIESQVNK